MKAILVVALGALLAACTGEEFGDLKAELKDKTKDLRGRIEPLSIRPIPSAARKSSWSRNRRAAEVADSSPISIVRRSRSKPIRWSR